MKQVPELTVEDSKSLCPGGHAINASSSLDTGTSAEAGASDGRNGSVSNGAGVAEGDGKYDSCCCEGVAGIKS